MLEMFELLGRHPEWHEPNRSFQPTPRGAVEFVRCAEPRHADETLTLALKQALALVDVRVLDHFGDKQGNWWVDKVYRGTRLRQCFGQNLEEAQSWLIHQLEQLRQISFVRPTCQADL